MAGVRVAGFPLFSALAPGTKVVRQICRTSLSISSQTCRKKFRGLPTKNSEVKFRVQSSIYEDGFIILRGFVKEDELPSITPEVLEQNHYQALLHSLIGERMKVDFSMERIQGPGFKCTDGATSPEPWWNENWEVEKEVPRLDGASETATLVLACSNGTARNCGGGFVVFPRSHWLIADWLWARAEGVIGPTLPQPPDVPAATAHELELGCGDAVILHPLIAWSLAPNRFNSTTKFIFFNLYTDFPQDGLSGRKVEHMWHGWTALASHVRRGLASFQFQKVALMEEEAKAIEGGWAAASLLTNLPELPFACTHVTPRDRLSWQIRSSAIKYMQEEMWEEAAVMLRQLAGLRPKSYWVVFNAGRCSILSAPCGQISGRAGRKSILEDGERFLTLAIEIAPGWPYAYAELAETLMIMGRGREQEIREVLQTMKGRCNIDQLYLTYPEVYDSLKQCEEKCESLLNALQEQ